MKKHNVRKFNATGDGVHDDRAAIQSAIDATIAAGGGVVFFPAGDYVVGRIPTPETSLASFYIHGVTIDTPLVFEGEGAASIIRMKEGSVGSGEKWSIFHVVASENVSFRHLRLHGNGRNITSPPGKKKIYCILLKQAVDVTVQNVEFRETVGHGIKLEGKRAEEGGDESRGLRILENFFVDSGRGGITLDGTRDPIEDVVIQGNIVRHTLKSFAVLVVLDNTHRVQFVSNTILGGAVQCKRIQDFVISNNIIVGVSDKNGDGLLLEGALRGAVIGNNIHAENSILAEPTSGYKGISVHPSNGQSSEQIRLSQNTIVARQTGINMGGQDISVSDNLIERVTEGTGDVGINVGRSGSIDHPPPLGDAIQVRNNHIRNFKYGIQASGAREDLTRLVVVGNQTRGSTGAAIHITRGVPAATVHGNQAAPGETPLILVPGYIVTAAGFAGNGSPEGVVPAEVGSLYTRLDEDPEQDPDLARLWVKEKGTDSRGWGQVVTAPLPPSNPVSP